MSIPTLDGLKNECVDQSLTKQGSIHEVESLISRKRVLRKIDLWLLSMMFITYGFQFLDKAILGYAAVYTLLEDNHLEGQDYSWVTSIFYFGYLLFEYPLTALLARFRVEQYLGVMVALWGLTLLLANLCSSFAGLAINRFFLGALESIVAYNESSRFGVTERREVTGNELVEKTTNGCIFSVCNV